MTKTWITSPGEPEGLGEAFGFQTDKHGNGTPAHQQEQSNAPITSQQRKERKALEKLLPDTSMLL